MCRHKLRVKEKEEIEKYVPRKKKDKSLETDSKEMKIYDLYVRVFKLIIIKMFTKVRRIMNEWSKNFNRVYIYNQSIEEYNNWTEKFTSAFQH